MAVQKASFTPNAAGKIVDAVKGWNNTPIDMRGRKGIVRTGDDGMGLFKVIGLPAAISEVVPTYVTAVPYYNGTAGTAQSSIGITVPHAVGDFLLAAPCDGGSEPGGTPQNDAAGHAITMMEVGSFGLGIRCPVVAYGSGSNGSIGVASTLTYSPQDPGNTVQLAIDLEVKEARSFPLPVTAATFGMVAIDNKTGTWILLSVEEVYLVVACPTGGG